MGASPGAARGVGTAVLTLGTRSNGRALSSLCSGRNTGAMNIPEKPLMHNSIFYLPRNSEMQYEDKLFENKFKHRNYLMK